MKHTFKITLMLLLMFLLSQIIGVYIISKYIDYPQTKEVGKAVFIEPPIGEWPKVENQSTSFTYIFIAILIGTLILFIFIKFKLYLIWKLWYALAIVFCLTYAFGAFVPWIFAGILSILLVAYKLFKPNIIVNNIIELFLYGGLASIFIPGFLNFFSATILLLLISLYDMYAVWKSKHMVKLANFQTESKVFAGLSVPYKMPALIKPKGVKVKKEKVKTAILGGGDIGFPLLFAGAVFKDLIGTETLGIAFSLTMIISLFAAIALAGLLLYSKKDRFYPAMPFISAGCFLGYGVMLLARIII